MGPPKKYDARSFRYDVDKSYLDAARKIAIVPSLLACQVRVDARSASHIGRRFTYERARFFFSCLRIVDSSFGRRWEKYFCQQRAIGKASTRREALTRRDRPRFSRPTAIFNDVLPIQRRKNHHAKWQTNRTLGCGHCNGAIRAADRSH